MMMSLCFVVAAEDLVHQTRVQGGLEQLSPPGIPAPDHQPEANQQAQHPQRPHAERRPHGDSALRRQIPKDLTQIYCGSIMDLLVLTRDLLWIRGRSVGDSQDRTNKVFISDLLEFVSVCIRVA